MPLSMPAVYPRCAQNWLGPGLIAVPRASGGFKDGGGGQLPGPRHLTESPRHRIGEPARPQGAAGEPAYWRRGPAVFSHNNEGLGAYFGFPNPTLPAGENHSPRLNPNWKQT